MLFMQLSTISAGIWKDVLKKRRSSEYNYVIYSCCNIVYSVLSITIPLTFTYQIVDVNVHVIHCSHQIYRCHEYQGTYGRIVIDLEKMKASQQEAVYVSFLHI